jgi:hypothetical protein
VSDRVPLGETRREAISRVQERLGSAASRPLAEQTFWALAKKGKITMDNEGAYLIEADIDDKSLRDTATDTIQQVNQQQTKMNRSRGVRNMRHFSVNHKNMHQARVSTVWRSASAKTMFAPSLAGAEGYNPADSADDELLPPSDK